MRNQWTMNNGKMTMSSENLLLRQEEIVKKRTESANAAW